VSNTNYDLSIYTITPSGVKVFCKANLDPSMVNIKRNSIIEIDENNQIVLNIIKMRI